MQFFYNLKIGRRLGLGFGIQLLLIAIILSIGIYNVTMIRTTVEQIVKVVSRKAELTTTISSAIDSIYLDVAEMLSSSDPKGMAENMRSINAKRTEYKNAMDELEKLENFEEGKKLIATLKGKITQVRDGNDRVLELALAGKQEMAAKRYHKVIKNVRHEVIKSLEELSAYQHGRFTVRFQETVNYIGTTRNELLLAGLVALLISIGLGFTTTLSITRPIDQGVKFVNRMAGGDLTQTLDIRQQDELGILAKALNDMAWSLRRMFGEMSDGVQTLSSSATELAAISQQMTSSAEHSSSRAHSVAAAAEEMSASLASVAGAMDHATNNVSSVATATEEMTSTISEVARSSEKARVITVQAVVQASEITRQVVELGRAAREIGKVTETITAISAQTNLLALNATIEAASAGGGRQGLRRGGQRGQGTGQADRHGHRGHQRQDRGHPKRHEGGRHGDRPDRPDHQSDQ